jgi:hypothetical protein
MTDNIIDFLREKFTRLDARLDTFETDLRALGGDVRVLKEDMVVTAATLRRLDVKQDVLLAELRALYPQISHLRTRVDDLEALRGPPA